MDRPAGADQVIDDLETTIVQLDVLQKEQDASLEKAVKISKEIEHRKSKDSLSHLGLTIVL